MIVRVAQLLFVLALLGGAVSLGRVSSQFSQAGAMGELRLLVPLGLASVAVLMQAVRGNVSGLRPPARTFLLATLFAHALVALSWLWSERIEFGKTQLYELSLLAAVLLLTVGLFRHNPRGAVRLFMHTFYWVAVVFVLISLVAFGSLQGELAFIGAGGIGSARILGAGGLAAAYLAMRSGRVIWLVPVPLMIVGILLSGSRAALLALFLSVAFLWLVRASVVVPERLTGTLLVKSLRYGAIAGMTIAFFWSSYGMAVVAEFVASNIVPQAGAGGPGLYLADRDVIFADAWAKFSERPLGGLGLGTYLGPWGEFYPHNLLLSFAVDAGVIAAMSGTLALAFGFLSAVRIHVAEARCAVASGVFFLIASMFAGSYYDARFIWVFLLLACMMRTGQSTGPEGRIASPGILRI